MKVEDIKAIVELMADNDLTEFKLEAEDTRLCIRRGAEQQPVSQMLPPPMMSQPAPAAAPAPQVSSEAGPELATETIDSPIVGTFYSAPSPDAEPFVQVGSKVSPDTVVCIVEAMKVMNEIKAEKSGVIKEILAQNAQAVEFGQPLFVLE